jgi:hypothetical protein
MAACANDVFLLFSTNNYINDHNATTIKTRDTMNIDLKAILDV